MNQSQLAGIARLIVNVILGAVTAHGVIIKDSAGTQSALEIIVSTLLMAFMGWLSHRSNTPAAMLNSAVQASGGAISATTSPSSSDTTIVVRKPEDVPAAVVATVQPKTP